MGPSDQADRTLHFALLAVCPQSEVVAISEEAGCLPEPVGEGGLQTELLTDGHGS